MKHLLFYACFIIFLSLSAVSVKGQEQDSLDWDIDSIFDEFLEEDDEEEVILSNEPTIQNIIRQRGYNFEAFFRFVSGYNYGWFEVPWYSNPLDEGASFSELVIKMYSSFSIDAQISNSFRAKATVYFIIPKFGFQLGDFFFDYNIYDTVFVRGGKYNLAWGISNNYSFANLLARVPENSYNGQSFILKADVPIGIGGFQVLALTRENLLGGVAPKKEDLGYGAKYNLALRKADLNLGVFYREEMPFRSFFSAKTTIMETEIYNEWLLAVDPNMDNEISFAANLGFSRDFFDGKFNVGAEIFFNGEGNAYWYRPEEWYRESEISPFIEGINAAFNLLYKFDTKNDPRLFLQTRYSFLEESAFLVPGFSINPLPNLGLRLSVPMAVGNRDGYYYSHTGFKNDKNKPLAFTIVLLLSLSGRVNYGHYY